MYIHHVIECFEIYNHKKCDLNTKKKKQEIEKILQNACKCKNVSISEVVSAVKNGADTFEKVAETTGAGTAWGRCKEIILNIIENKR